MAAPAGPRPGPRDVVFASTAPGARTWLALAAAIVLVWFDPATTWWLPSCPFRALTGWLCPLCGSLRALHALLLGAPALAWSLNPVTTTCAIAGLLAWIHDTVCPGRATQCARLTRLCVSPRGLALVFAFGVIRNASALVGGIVH